MTAEEIFNKHMGRDWITKPTILAAIQEALNEGRKEVSLALFQCREELDELKQVHHLKEIENNSLRNRLAELEKENQELREGHYANVTDAYDAGHEDGHYGAHGVILHKYLDSHDYYTKTFNNEK